MFLSRFADKVRIIQRQPKLTASRLLQDKVSNDPRFAVQLNSEVAELKGRGALESVVVRDRATGKTEMVPAKAAFVFIGLDPNTTFLRGTVDLDERGFIKDDGDFATSLPGVFVAGDVRRGSTKQLGSAVGDGIAAVLAVRRYLEVHHDIAAHVSD